MGGVITHNRKWSPEVSNPNSNRQALAPDDPRHGTRNGYGNLGCRCDRCRAANTAYCGEQRAARTTPATPVHHPDLPGEEWLPVVGYEGMYEVSNKGRVRSLDRTWTQWHGGLVPILGTMLSQVCHPDSGYMTVHLSKEGRKRRRPVHVLLLESFVGPQPEGMEGCHNNGKPGDNRRENLRWDTHSANMFDAVRHGTHPLLRQNRRRRLTAQSVEVAA